MPRARALQRILAAIEELLLDLGCLVGATLGLTTLVFQSLVGQGGITFYVPFVAAVLLVALGADYNIFGVGYIWAEARDRPLVEAIRVAVPRSTRAINVAGITLALSFAILAVVPLSPFREFAFAMAVGIVIDVFVVRSFLVPSLVSLVGTASGWPGRSLRRSPQEMAAGGERIPRPVLPGAPAPAPAPVGTGAPTGAVSVQHRSRGRGGCPEFRGTSVAAR
jgi:RND superfamily putative drug exporter